MIDSSSNIINAAERFIGVITIPCAVHRLNLIVSDVFEEKVIKLKQIKGNK